MVEKKIKTIKSDKKEEKKRDKKVETKKRVTKKKVIKKGKKESSKKKVTKKKVSKKKIVGGSNFATDIQRSGQGLGLAIGHTFTSLANMGKDLYCEMDAVMNIPKELDMGSPSVSDCPFTESKSWSWTQIKQ